MAFSSDDEPGSGGRAGTAGEFDGAKLMAATNLHTFDDLFTAPVHGFKDADDYYARASARPHLRRIRIPALALNAHGRLELFARGNDGALWHIWQEELGGAWSAWYS